MKSVRNALPEDAYQKKTNPSDLIVKNRINLAQCFFWKQSTFVSNVKM